MAKNTTKNTISTINQIFDDLDKYRLFCSQYGYYFDEADLYDQRNFVYRQFQRFLSGKPVKNQWEVDYLKWKEQEAAKLAKS